MTSNFINDFDRQKTFKVGYITKNSKSSKKYKSHDEKYIGLKNLLLAKGN